MFDQNEFRKYATKHLGISSTSLDKFTSHVNGYISPTIIEERQMNVASMVTGFFTPLILSIPSITAVVSPVWRMTVLSKVATGKAEASNIFGDLSSSSKT